jgi:hypothetical protein
MSGHNDPIIDKQSTALGFLARLWWMFFGNMLLAFSLLFLLFNKGSFFHPADWVFWIVVASLIFMRFIDIRFCDGQTATGRPASLTNWTRYGAVLLAGSVAVWGIAHALNYLFADRIAQI